jgi:hypothetical protein
MLPQKWLAVHLILFDHTLPVRAALRAIGAKARAMQAPFKPLRSHEHNQLTTVLDFPIFC